MRSRLADAATTTTAATAALALLATIGCQETPERALHAEEHHVESMQSMEKAAAPPAAEDRVVKSDAEWKKLLTPEQYRILRKKGTERAFTGATWDNHAPGTYVCAADGNLLFDSADKFDSGTGWPSFTRPATERSVTTEEDDTFFMRRTEVLCRRCGGHLGHVFDDGPPPTGKRYCMNSGAMTFVPRAR